MSLFFKCSGVCGFGVQALQCYCISCRVLCRGARDMSMLLQYGSNTLAGVGTTYSAGDAGLAVAGTLLPLASMQLPRQSIHSVFCCQLYFNTRWRWLETVDGYCIDLSPLSGNYVITYSVSTYYFKGLRCNRNAYLMH